TVPCCKREPVRSSQCSGRPRSEHWVHPSPCNDGSSPPSDRGTSAFRERRYRRPVGWRATSRFPVAHSRYKDPDSAPPLCRGVLSKKPTPQRKLCSLRTSGIAPDSQFPVRGKAGGGFGVSPRDTRCPTH